MTKDEIISDINRQISNIDRSFNPYVSIRNFKEKAYGNDICSLETLLKKAGRLFNLYALLTLIVSVILVIIAFGSIHALGDAVGVSRLRWMIVFDCSLIPSLIKYHNLKKRLENKIGWVRILNKVDQI